MNYSILVISSLFARESHKFSSKKYPINILTKNFPLYLGDLNILCILLKNQTKNRIETTKNRTQLKSTIDEFSLQKNFPTTSDVFSALFVSSSKPIDVIKTEIKWSTVQICSRLHSTLYKDQIRNFVRWSERDPTWWALVSDK